MNVLLVDDEPRIRLIIRRVVEQYPEFQVAGECSDMTEALIAFHKVRPDVVFMDIDLNGSSGIDCARVMMEENPDCILVFATAYGEYMPDAFELYAFDYLVKPFDIARIRQTLERILRKSESPLPETLPKKLMIKGKETVRLVNVDDIILAQREDHMTVLFTGEDRLECSMSLGELEQKLSGFVRCHRSYLINPEKISSIEPYGRWTYIVKFKGISEDALMTRSAFDRVRELFGDSI